MKARKFLRKIFFDIFFLRFKIVLQASQRSTVAAHLSSIVRSSVFKRRIIGKSSLMAHCPVCYTNLVLLLISEEGEFIKGPRTGDASTPVRLDARMPHKELLSVVSFRLQSFLLRIFERQ